MVIKWLLRLQEIRKCIYLLEIATYVKCQSWESRCNKDFYNLIFAYFWSMYNGNRMVCIYVIVFFPLCKWRQFIPKYNHLLSAVNAFGIYYMFCCNGLRTNFEYYLLCFSLHNNFSNFIFIFNKSTIRVKR